MKSTVSLVLSFFLCILGYAQHISEFESLAPGIQDENFYLPDTHTFQILFDTQDFLDLGGVIPSNFSGPNFDFTGYVPREGSSKSGYLSINSEIAPGAVTILDIEFDESIGRWRSTNSELVDFPFLLPSEPNWFATVANCSGTVTPWNTIITCEEYTSIELEARSGYDWVTSTDLNGDGYHDFGWAIEIDPVTKTIIDQPGGLLDKPDKLWAMGNFKHENAVIRADSRTVYQGADATYIGNDPANGGDGYLFKFIASNREDLSQGDLYVYKGDKISNHEWVKLANDTQANQNSTIAQCKALEATPFGGIEDVEINPIDSLVYFAVKSESIGDISKKGVIYRFKDTNTGIEEFDIYAGGNSIYDGVKWGGGNDNLVFDDLGNLWVAQDGSFTNGDNNYIWVIENGHTQANSKVKIFAKTPGKSEPTGLTFTPDFKYVFMSIQHPRGNDSFQTDVFGTAVNFNQDVVLVFARNEDLGRDEVLITQYYHDDATDSKWIEIKNISGNDIPAGAYSLNLYTGEGGEILLEDPVASENIPAMLKDEVLLFKNSPNPAQPTSEFIGNANQIESRVCDFNDNDIILITRIAGNGKYINRKDILGYSTPSAWGANKSLIRGGNSSEIPEKDFNPNNWIETDSLQEVSTAAKLKNIALGTHVTGPAVFNGSSWESNSPPDRTRNTEINGDYVGGQENIATYDLNINDGGSLKFELNTVGSNNNIYVHRNLVIDPEGSFIIGDTESLIIKNSSASISGKIKKIEKSTVRDHPNDMTYWSSPVQDEKIETVFEKVDPERIFHYDQIELINEGNYWEVWVNQNAGPMIVGKGYAAEGPIGEIGQQEISFTGKPNFGTINVSDIVFNNDQGNNENLENDWNLIGNPYPAAIDIEAFLTTNFDTNPVIDGTVYLWNHASGLKDGAYDPDDYVTYNFSGSIPDDIKKNIGSGQGFFVRAIKDDMVTFDHSMILAGANDQFFKGAKDKDNIEVNRLWINLQASDNSLKQLLIAFVENATDQMDSGYDALYLRGNQPIAFYSVLDDKKLSIQGLGSFSDDKQVKIGFDAEMEGLEMTIDLGRKEGVLKEQDILLFDHYNDVLHDLNTSPYTFKYDGKGQFKDRFSLLFNSSTLGLDEGTIVEEVKVFVKDQYLIIDAQNLIEQVKIYDTLGRLILKKQPQSVYSEFNLDRIKTGGFFIVELTDESGKTLNRKMIKY